MTFKEIKKELHELDITPGMLATDFENIADDLDTNDEDEDIYELGKRGIVLFADIPKIVKEVFGEYETVYSKRINDDDDKVLLFKDHNVYIKIEGWYSSHNGTSYDDSDFTECWPVDKVVTFYETKNQYKTNKKIIIMTAEEILKEIEESDIDICSLSYDMPGDIPEGFKEKFGEVDNVEENGGNEGEGEQCSFVLHFKDHNVFIRWEGWYASGNGRNYDEPGFEVKPQKQLIETYVPIDAEDNEALIKFCADLITKRT